VSGSMSYEIIFIGNVELRFDDNPLSGKRFPAVLEERVNQIWESFQAENGGKLFNDKLFCFAGSDICGSTMEIRGVLTEYKNFIAQRKQPHLNLDIKPVGVSGITLCTENGIKYAVFARRAESVTEYPGFLELVPSGSINGEFVDTAGVIEYKAQLALELFEETGITGSFVKGVQDFAFILDGNHSVYDICCEIELSIDIDSVLKKISGSEEYHEPIFVPVDELQSYIKGDRGSIIPTSRALIEAYFNYKNRF